MKLAGERTKHLHVNAQGHAMAQYNVGVYYRVGEVVEKNFAEAAQWFEKAAEQGIDDAMFQLGKLYQSGAGVERVSTNIAACVFVKPRHIRIISKQPNCSNVQAIYSIPKPCAVWVFCTSVVEESKRTTRKRLSCTKPLQTWVKLTVT